MEIERRQTQTGGRDAVLGLIEGDVALSVGMPKKQAPQGFQWKLLSDLARLESGHTPSRKVEEYWNGGSIPWVTVKHAAAHHGQTLYKTEEYITELGEQHSSARLLPANTVCLTRTGSLGFVVVMGVPMCTSQGLVNWVCGPEIDFRYLKYILLAESESFHRFSWGSAHQTIYFPEVKAFHVLLPELAEQRAIADVLGALDDKIESNRRLIRNLDELYMAECESALSVSSIPIRLGEVASLSLGGTPSKANSNFWDGGDIPWINSGRLHEFPVLTPSSFITPEGLSKSATKLIPKGSTVVAITGATLGVVSRLSIETAINQSIVAIECPGNVELNGFMLYALRANMAELVSSATGAAQQHVNKANFEELVIRMPTAEDLGLLQIIPSLLDQIDVLAHENVTLSILRNTVLPELLSGRLRVNEAESIVENV